MAGELGKTAQFGLSFNCGQIKLDKVL